MTPGTWLEIGAIGLPLIGALAIWRGGARFPRAQRWLAAIILGLVGLIALTLFLINRYYACVLAFGKQNCLFEGVAMLSLSLLSALLARGCYVLRGENRGPDYILMLLLSATCAGMGIGLIENLLLFIVSLNLFLFVFDRFLRRKGLRWRFLILRDDYKDGPT